MAGKVVDRRLLLAGKGRRQPEAGRRRCGSLVADHQATAGIGQRPLDVGEQAAGEHEPVEGLLVAADEPRRAPGRQPQPLLLVEGGVVERRQVLQRRHQRRRQPEPFDGEHRPKLGPHLPRWRRPVTAEGSQRLAAGTRLDRA
jgi:hypothetical protein